MPAEKFKEIYDRNGSIPKLAIFFNVSLAAVQVRMKRLGINYE
jgi:hypothetical protein